MTKIITSIVCFLCFCLQTNAQTFPGLLDLTGYGQKVYYSPGQEERAKEIAGICDRANVYFQKLFSFKPNTKLFILAPSEWKQYATHPVYGMPHYSSKDGSRLVMASEDNAFWKSFLPPMDKLSPALAGNVRKAYTNKDGVLSMMPFFDLLALHELAHGFHKQGGLTMQRLWMQEMFANVMLHTYIAENEPKLLPALTTFPEMVVAAGTEGYKYTSLADFEKYYENGTIPPKNYGWYQCRLHVAAKDIYNAGGTKVLLKLWSALKSPDTKMNDTEFAAFLEKNVDTVVANVPLKW